MNKTTLPFIDLIGRQPNLDIVVKTLIAAKNDNINWYFDFLGHKLYSDTVSLEDAYQEVYNMSSKEYKEDLKKRYKKYKENEIESFKTAIKVRYPYNFKEKVDEYVDFLKQEEINKSLEERLELFDREVTNTYLALYHFGSVNTLKKTR